ncbi:UNVERIFIED_CONTAM: hypothetical protein Sradi_4163100 [Sesamum radiatum]|uniref:Uncharacterized protein n=1 Tax=Sesamum radiatum TaxID=300843 RepID=A0AAW2P5E6_SESRA
MRGFMAEYYNWTSHGEDVVQDYFEAPRVPQVSEEPTPAGHVEAGPSYFASSHEGILDDDMKSCPVDVGTSSYVHSSDGPYDYDESGLADCFSNIVHAADQPLWEEYPNRLIEYFPPITLSRDYYSTKKLVKNLGLPVEKLHACKNGCMLYWKDDVDLEYCKFCGDGRYKPTRGRDPHRKKSQYVVLRYLPPTPALQRLYSSRATAEHMTWHATYQTEKGSLCHPSNAEA